MAALPPATSISSSHLDELLLSRVPFFSGEALGLRHLQKQRLPISHSKQNAPLSLCDRASAWKSLAIAASAPQINLSFGALEKEVAAEDTDDEKEAEEEGEEEEEEGAVTADCSLFEWSSQWYPVSLIDDLDKRVPTAVTIMGRHLVVSWDRTLQSWKVWDDKGPETSASLSDGQIQGKADSQISSASDPLAFRLQGVHPSVYPSIEQDGLLWFWPDTRPEFEDIATRKLPPSIPAFTDSAFKDKLHSMNLPYGYKKMIENFLEPACIPFAHDEPQEDFLQDFEKRLRKTTGYPSDRSSVVHSGKKDYERGVLSNTDGHTCEAASLSSKAVKNGSTNARVELSHAVTQNGVSGRNSNNVSKTNGSTHAEVQNGVPGYRSYGIHKTNGSVNAKMEIPSEAAQKSASDSSASNFSNINGSVYKSKDYSVNNSDSVRGGSGNINMQSAHAAAQKSALDSSKTASKESLPQKMEDGLHSGTVLSQSFLGKSSKEDVLKTDRLQIAGSTEYSNVSSSTSSVVLKKPSTSSRPTFEEEASGMTDPSGVTRTSDVDMPTGMTSKSLSVSSLDLMSSLQGVRLLVYQKNYDLARGIVKELYEKYPCDTDVLMEYAYVEKQLGDLVAAGSLYSQAISAFEAQQNLGYDYVRALQALGSIEARARNARRARVLFMESIRAAHQAEQLSPDSISGASVYGLHAWARLEEQVGNWGKARELLARAAEIQPGNAVIHQSRALLEAKAHNWGIARYHFSLAVDAAPNDIKCWHAWAIFEASRGEQEKMRELFQRALEVDPNSVHCLQAWAHQETLIGTPESMHTARSLFQRCTEIEPKSLFSWQAWAVMEKNAGNYDKSRELFEKCLKLNSSSVACLQAYANMERHCENWGAARRLLRKAFKLEPENGAVLMEAAFVEQSVGNMEMAERLFILAGMADRRKSRVRNKMFASRKEVMEREIGMGWRDLVKVHPKHSATFNGKVGAVKLNRERLKIGTVKCSSHSRHNSNANFQVVIDAIKAKQREKKNPVVERQHHAHLKQQGSKLTNFQAAINAIKAKQREFKGSFKTERRSSLRENRSKTNFQTILEAIEAKRTDFNSDTEKEYQLSLHLKQGERASSMLGA